VIVALTIEEVQEELTEAYANAKLLEEKVEDLEKKNSALEDEVSELKYKIETAQEALK